LPHDEGEGDAAERQALAAEQALEDHRPQGFEQLFEERLELRAGRHVRA
jgi:hypothetical protein